MLQVNDLTITNIKEDRVLVADLSFVLNPGARLAVIGEEGNGKSTLLKVLAGAEPPYLSISGEIVRPGTVGYLEQDTRGRWGKANVLDYLLLSDPDGHIEADDYALLAHLDQTLSRLSFPMDSYSAGKTIGEFSGGEIVKLGLCKILLRDPDVLLLDEPSNDLDLESIVFLEDFMLKEKRPLIFVSHDEALLEAVSTCVIHLAQIHKKKVARSVYSALPYREYKERQLALNESQGMIARKQRSDYRKKIARFRQIYQAVEYAQNTITRSDPSTGRLLKKHIHLLKSEERRLEKQKETFAEIPEEDAYMKMAFDGAVALPAGKVFIDLSIKELKAGDRVLAKDLRLTFKGPVRVAVIGHNGVGKSTLLRAIKAELSGKPGIKVGYMPQDYDEVLDETKTALENLTASKDKDEEARLRQIMGNLLFTPEEMLYPVERLSGGEKAKLLFLKLILEKDNVLLLDEPTRNLSPLSAPVIYDLLNSYKGAIIAVSHDRRFIDSVFDEIFQLTVHGLQKL